jgi:hypothetical protein
VKKEDHHKREGKTSENGTQRNIFGKQYGHKEYSDAYKGGNGIERKDHAE